MKKKFWLLGVMAAIFAFSIIGCSTTYKYGPVDTPPDQMATLKILGSELRVVAADEHGVKWKGGGLFAGGNTVNLPAGRYTFTVDYKKGNLATSMLGAGNTDAVYAMHVGEKLLPGHTYQLKDVGGYSRVQLQLTDVTNTAGGTK
ncbi:MAG: hypothetical protein LBK61_13520 [Spirochaetaceae bacterium]|jgi:hypothetical protein|nr:hypothetical protein [Spirochaetaceae bacterium]